MKSPIRIPNWVKFQHYKNKTPSWIKLHRSTLNSREWNDLSGDAAKLLIELWLVASETPEGIIEAQTADLAWRLRRPFDQFVSLLLELERNGQVELAVRDDGTAINTNPTTFPQPSRPELEVEVRGRGEERREQIKATPAVASIEHTISSVALEAHAVLGKGLWGDELSKKFRDTKRIITTTWVASGVSLAAVSEAIHGLRLMVDAGEPSWLADRKGKPLDGIHVLTKASAVLPGPDGAQLRSLFDAARDAYHTHEMRKSRGATSGPRRLTIELPETDGGFAA